MSLISNAKWNSFSQIFKVISQVVNIVYLARIIPPSEYGVMAMALVVVNLGILLRDMGTSAVLIQRRELSSTLINTVFWMNTISGIIIGVIVFFLSPVIASVYKQDELISVLMLLSLIFPLSSCAATHLALLERDSRFKRISYIEITSSLSGLIVAIFLANLGFGIYSLVFQSIVMTGMSALQFWFASNWKPSFRKFICIEELKGIFGFSGNLALFNFVNYFSRNADSFIVGKFMSASILGCYNLAYRIMLFPLQSITFVAARSLYPVLSRNQDDHDLIGNIYLRAVFFISCITFPLMSGLAVVSSQFVTLVFGEQWTLTAEILTWLAPTAIIQSILSTTGSVFMAKNSTYLMMKLGILGSVFQVGAFLIGVHYTIVTFAMLYLIANILNFFPTMFYLLKIINVSWTRFIFNILPAIASTIIMIVSLYVLNYFVDIHSYSNLVGLFIQSIFGFFVYIASISLLSKKIRMLIRNVLIQEISL
ncbi:TPA: MOP flippase family protein [Klebsiella pneumoniae]|nr:MOP flippase family protein [Klebsiella pneumoniae]